VCFFFFSFLGTSYFRESKRKQCLKRTKMPENEHSKLYVKTGCLVCLNKVYSCSYCDGVGSVFVEASDKTVSKWFSQLTDDRKQDIINMATIKEGD